MKNSSQKPREELLKLLLEIMGKSPDFEYISGTQPFQIKFKGELFWVYLKNLSSAYFENQPNITRVQLPQKEEFEEIKRSGNCFILFGYDCINDVMVCWDFYLVKERLNKKRNVSFYSRDFWQNDVKYGEYRKEKLDSGDFLVLFKRQDLVGFFEKIHEFFDNSNNEKTLSEEQIQPKFPSLSQEKISVGGEKEKSDEIMKIVDKIMENEEILKQIEPLLFSKNVHTLEAIKVLEEFSTINAINVSTCVEILEKIKRKLSNSILPAKTGFGTN